MHATIDKLTDNNVFKEILSTEQTYNTSLKFLSLSLLIQLQFQEDPLFRRFHTLVEQLIEVSDGLSANVENSLANIDNPETREGLKGQRAKLLERFFEIYQSYEKLFNQYNELYKQNPTHFKQINFYMRKNHNSKLDFGAHVIMPIQRGPRYLLLVNELIEHNKGCDDFNKKEFVELQQLFGDSLSVFSSKKSGSSKRSYQFGDYTCSFFGLRNLNDQSNTTSLSSESKKQQKEGVVTSPEVNTESKAENQSPNSSTKGYRFGDVTRRLLWGADTNIEGQTTTVVTSVDDATTKEPENDQEEITKVTQLEMEAVSKTEKQSSTTAPQAYRFGDFTRRLIWGANTNHQGQTTAVSSSVGDTTKEESEDGFVLVNK